MIRKHPKTSKQRESETLPPIPEKRYFAIGEVSGLCRLKPHILRYWEQEFPQLKPGKRRGNRRYYQYEDVLMVRQIRKLLYEEGFTIHGARAQLAGSAYEVNKSLQLDTVVGKLVVELEGILEKLR